MEVMRLHLHIAKRQYMHGGRPHVDNAVLILERAIDAEELSARHRHAVPFIQLRIDDCVRNTRLIFETKEDEALGCARTLSRDHRACDAGTRCANVDSIWTRIAAAEGISVFVLYSPIELPFRQPPLAPERVQSLVSHWKIREE
jgi:hypothetical protein